MSQANSNTQNDSAVYPWLGTYTSNPGLSDKDTNPPKLFQPLKLRELTLKNRIVVSPMCMYSAKDGNVGDFHLVHLGSFALGGAGLVFMEATGVTLQGRISPFCPSIHHDDQIPAIKRIADFVHANGAAFGIQLAHSGRKGSCPAPFQGRGSYIDVASGGWEVIGPSPIPYNSDHATPREMTLDDIKQLIQDFVDATIRSDKAGIDVIEIHAAHGYLVNQFLSPTSNHRTDEYGGSIENRCRLLFEIVTAVRKVWPAGKPIFVRASCEEWVDDGWNMQDTVWLAKKLKELDVDILDCSSGGNNPAQKILGLFQGYQVPYAAEAKKESGIGTLALGLITEPKEAESILQEGSADLIGIGRQHLRNPFWALQAAQELSSQPAQWIPQYAWAVNLKLPRVYKN